MTMTHLLESKQWRLVALIGVIAFGGVVLSVLNWMAGFSYAGNSPVAIVAHIVGTMLWGATCAAAIRWSKL